MTPILVALAGLALAVSTPAHPAHAKSPASKPAKTVKAKTDAAAVAVVVSPSAAVERVASWVAASSDNGSLPYAIVDKQAATLFLFDPSGKAIGTSPVLVGRAIGDEATPGIGSKNLAEIGPAEKTTPAGRFLARYGLAVGKQKILWVDYATSVALHPIPPGANPKERRRQRMQSADPTQHRITFGCINVPAAFYTRSVQPQFQKGGYVYVLPDVKPLETVFPLLLTQATKPAVGAAPAENAAAAP